MPMTFDRSRLALCLLASSAVSAAAQSTNPSRITVHAQNALTIARADETVSLPWDDVQKRLGTTPARVRVIDAEAREIASQVVDNDGDGKPDALIFQGDFAPKEQRHFIVEASAPTQKYEAKVAVRHDDPRDDMAWESDRVAFRIYGEGLKKTPSAMSSSGIDVWNKKTRALIVEKWYGKGHDNYHVDVGEGADFYDVGETLGNGGTAGWKNDTLWRADNFKQWRVIATGPIRAIFELKYDPWNVAGTPVSETKRIAIDAGANVYRAESVFLTPAGGDIPYVVGTVKRPGMIGTMSKNYAWAWLTGWGPVAPKSGGHGEMGTAVLLPRSTVADWKEAHGHYLAVSHATSGKPVVHYVGAGWTDSGDFPTPQSWWKYLDETAQRLDSPLKVTVDAGH
jgi:pectinesterase